MTDKVTISFRPRYYECDPLGQLYTANYLRFMLEAALEAGAAADLNSSDHAAPDWLQRVGDVGLLVTQPISYGDVLEVQTWLSRRGPPVWRHEFSFARAGSQVSAAVGFVELYEVDDEQEAELDEPQVGDGGAPIWSGELPDPPEPPGRAFHAVWRASWLNMDISGQLDPGYLTQAVVDIEGRAGEAAGWGLSRDQELGIAWQATEHRLEMFEDIQPGDTLNITSYIGDVGDQDMIRHARIERLDSGVLVEVAHARTRWACLDAASGQPHAIPDDWIEDLADQMADE
jgi:acyl-CoA thioesterase FadM